MRLPSGEAGRWPVEAQHERLARAVDVGVEEADARALRAPRPARDSTATVDLPTPPLPEATATTLLDAAQAA